MPDQIHLQLSVSVRLIKEIMLEEIFLLSMRFLLVLGLVDSGKQLAGAILELRLQLANLNRVVA